MDQKQYQWRVREAEPRRPIARNAFWAFVVGGVICTAAQGVLTLWQAAGYSELEARSSTAITMVAIGAILTGFGIYDRIAEFAGMGAALPITGFSNAVVSPAIEFKHEGAVLGTGARLFQVAGPVIVYGMLAAFVVGLVHLFIPGLKP